MCSKSFSTIFEVWMMRILGSGCWRRVVFFSVKSWYILLERFCLLDGGVSPVEEMIFGCLWRSPSQFKAVAFSCNMFFDRAYNSAKSCKETCLRCEYFDQLWFLWLCRRNNNPTIFALWGGFKDLAQGVLLITNEFSQSS